MLTWAARSECRLRFLREALDDDAAADCGRCDRCIERDWQRQPDTLLVAAAHDVLRGSDLVVEPRRQWPSGLDEPRGRIAPERQAAPGRALARLGDGGWNPVVEQLIADCESGGPVTVPAELVDAIAATLKRWDWAERPTWICPLPSRRRSALVDGIVAALGRLGRLPVHPALVGSDDPGYQSQQANSAHQVANVWARYRVDLAAFPDARLPPGPVLLVDDEVDSRWTTTVAAWQLRTAGSGAVLPFALRAR